MFRLLRLFVTASACIGFVVCLAGFIWPQLSVAQQAVDGSKGSSRSTLSSQVTALDQGSSLYASLAYIGFANGGGQAPPGVNSGQPQASFFVDATTVSVGQSVVFTDSSTGDIASWQWDFGDGTGSVGWDASTKPVDGRVSYAYASAGTYTVSLTASSPAGSDTATAVVFVTDSPIERVQQGITPQGGTVETADAEIVAEFPAGAVTADATVYVTELPAEAIPAAPDGFKIGSKCIELRAVDVSGQTISVLSQPVTLTIRYSDEDMAMAGGDPNDLVLAFVDTNTNQWTHVDPSVNAVDQTLSATASQLGIWAILSENPAAGTAKWVWAIICVAAGLAAIALAILLRKRLAGRRHRGQS